MFSYSNSINHQKRKPLVSRLNSFLTRLTAVAAVLAMATAATFAAGNLDKTFGTNGKAVTPIGNASDKGFALAVQPDGKILMAGASVTGSDFDTAVARYNADGTPDQDFGTGGKKVFNLSSAGEVIYALALQADGKIVMAGSLLSGGESNFLVVRLNTDGTLDTSFDGDGWANTPVGAAGASDTAKAVTIQNVDGEERIVVAGDSGLDVAVVRYKSDGTLDTAFDTDGLVITSIRSNVDNAEGVVIQRIGTDDKIVIAGMSRFDAGGGSFNDDFALVRYNTNGTLDTTFDTDGKVTTNISAVDAGRDLVIQRIDNLSKIVVGGISKRPWPHNDFTLVRYNENGSVDTTFGTNGRAFTPIANHDDQILALALQPDNKIIAAGFAGTGPTGTNQDFALARFNANGTLDTSFGSCGKIITAIASGNNDDIAYGVALQPDGKVVAAGHVTVSVSPVFNEDFAVLRYTPDGRAATPSSVDFDGDGKSDVAVYRPSMGAWYQNRSCAAPKSVQFGLSTDKLVPADYDGDGKTDVAVFRNGDWYILKSSTGTISGQQWGLATDIPVTGDFDNDGRADIAVFRPANGYWYVSNSSNGQTQSVNLGLEGDIPVAADYNGDGATEFAVFRPSTGFWYTSTDPATNYGAVQFGQQGDVPVAGDYDGDGRADVAVYRPADGAWYLNQSSAGFRVFQFGLSTDVPVAGDFDGDSKNDFAVYRNGAWYIQQTTGGMRSVNWGTAGDIPVAVR